MGYIPWGHKELDRTEWLTLSLSLRIAERALLSSYSYDKGFKLSLTGSTWSDLSHLNICEWS